MKFVQKLGKALMLPVACLPICGILMGYNGLIN
jgi:PTS system N-acetylglucosamine-specific IIC component